MKKSIIIVDLLLFLAFAGLIVGKILKWSFVSKFQVVFMVLIAVHIWQHWKTMWALFKKLVN